MKKVIILCSVFLSNLVQAQDLSSLLDSVETKKSEKVYATFKDSKIINAQSVETAKKNTLVFDISHRFGNIGVASNGGSHTLWGFDNSEDIRFSFDYGITDKITLGFARSKQRENLDFTFKYRFLEQTSDNKIPVTIALYENAAYSPMKGSAFYEGTENVEQKAVHRFSYISQLIIARKFNWRFSLELLPTYSHRNFVKAYVNSSNGEVDENGIFAMGVAGRIKLTKRFSIVADYFYTFSKYRTGNEEIKYYNPLAVGVEIETGGHVFHINLTNASGIIENQFIPETHDSWLKGGYKFGFNISRVFNF